jgi:hypothetical protein
MSADVGVPDAPIVRDRTIRRKPAFLKCRLDHTSRQYDCNVLVGGGEHGRCQRGDERGNAVRRGDHRHDEAFQDANLLDAADNAKAAITSQVSLPFVARGELIYR